MLESSLREGVKMYKLLAFDVDGTLVEKEERLSKETIEALKRVRDQGIQITIATGRSYSGITQIIDEVGFKLPVITFNGANVVDVESEEVIYSKELNDDDAKILDQLSKEFEIPYIVWANNNLYASEMNEKVKWYAERFNCNAYIVEDFSEALSYGVTKFLWFLKIEDVDGVKKRLEGRVPESVSYFTSRPEFLEFINADVSKGVALDFLATKLGIKQSEVMAFGDGENDMEMIKYAGKGIAMGNAKDHVKAVADYVTDANTENGIANAINKFI